MSIISVDDYLVEIDAAEPSGPNLEYDPDFLELEQAIQGKPEVQYGDTITPAVPPEWKVVKNLAQDLLRRSRDLRVAVPLARALMALHGIVGFADGLHLVQRLLLERWENVHPQLDPDDDNDPMLRINSLTSLIDLATTIKELKECTLIMLPGLGPLNLRMLEIANGELSVPEDQAKISIASIEAALRDVDPERFQVALDALNLACTSAVEIEDGLVRQVGSSQALNLSPLVKNLKRARDFVAASAGGEAAAAGDAAVDAGAEGGAPVATGGGAAARPATISGEIASREDVMKMIDKICVYYQKYEPSSPVPLLLERAKRLVTKNFMEIMEDLAPDGINQVTVISGVQPKQDDDDGY